MIKDRVGIFLDDKNLHYRLISRAINIIKDKYNHYCPGISSNKFSWLADIGFSVL
jgi:hypothetical protein